MRFALALCETCNGTGETYTESHHCDCPDCLGTGYVHPQQRIMNLQNEIAHLEEKLNRKMDELEKVTAHRDSLVAAGLPPYDAKGHSDTYP